MNELYNKYIQVGDRTYRYDPDFDCFYRVYPTPPETELHRWSVVGICVCLLLAICYFGPILLQ